jgi:carbon storage regulator
MLVLSRKIGERIHIGENITVEIRRVAGNRVTLALDAPRSVRILRGELNQAAREFRDEPQPQCVSGEESTHGCESSAAFDGQAAAEPANAADALSGPEPYAVIHRRLHVIPQLSPTTSLPHPATM